MRNLSSFFFAMILLLCSCQDEICHDLAPIDNCTPDDYVGIWQPIDYTNNINDDECFGNLIPQELNKEDIIIELSDNPKLGDIKIDNSYFRISYTNNCKATSGTNLISYEEHELISPERLEVLNAYFIVGRFCVAYRKRN